MFNNLTPTQVRKLKELSNKIKAIKLDPTKPLIKTGFNLSGQYTCFSVPLSLDAWLDSETPRVSIVLSQPEKDIIRKVLLDVLNANINTVLNGMIAQINTVVSTNKNTVIADLQAQLNEWNAI